MYQVVDVTPFHCVIPAIQRVDCTQGSRFQVNYKGREQKRQVSGELEREEAALAAAPGSVATSVMPETLNTELAASVLEAVPTPVWAVDASLRVELCNAIAQQHSWTRIKDGAYQLCAGKAMNSWLAEQVAQVLQAGLRSVLAKDSLPACMAKLPFKEMVLAPLDNQLVAVVLVSDGDAPPVTKSSEQGEIERTVACLNCQKYLDNAPDGLLVFDRSGRIYETNRTASRIFGHPEMALAQMMLAELVAGADQYKLFEELRRLQAGEERTLELAGLKADGQQFYFQLNLTSLEAGIFLGFVRDITERRRAE